MPLLTPDTQPRLLEISLADKVSRGNASQFFVAGELCRRGHSAAITLGNTPNVDILSSNTEGTAFVHIQVKTFQPGTESVALGRKAETDFGKSFFWVLGGIPSPHSKESFIYYIIPSCEMAKNVKAGHARWIATLGKNGKPHKDNDMRRIKLRPKDDIEGWYRQYENKWDLIGEALKEKKPTQQVQG